MADPTETPAIASDPPARAGNVSAPGGEAAGPSLPPDALVILPLRNSVVFPGMVQPIAVNRERSIAAAQAAVREQRPLGLLLQRDPETVEPGPTDLYEIGAPAVILRYLTGADGAHNVICQ